MTTILNTMKHYIGIALILVVVYFVGSGLLSQYHDKVYHGPAVVVTQPTPKPGAEAAIQHVVDALKDKALSDALAGNAVALSASQQSIANALSQSTGISARMAGALAEGLTRPSPKVQVIDVGTHATSTLAPPPILANDDAIKRDMKEVLADTTIKTDVKTDVRVHWEDKPFSPIFTAYGNDGYAGLGYTLHRAPALSLDALVLAKPGVHRDIEAGVGVEHVFRGTSAGLGVAALYNINAHQPKVGVFAAIHF